MSENRYVLNFMELQNKYCSWFHGLIKKYVYKLFQDFAYLIRYSFFVYSVTTDTMVTNFE